MENEALSCCRRGEPLAQVTKELLNRRYRLASSQNSQQQNALGYNLSMQGIGTVAIDGPRFEEFLRSRKDSFEVSQRGLARGSRKDFAVGLHSLVNVSVSTQNMA